MSISPLELARQFDLPFAPDFQPRFNIAPTQLAPVIRQNEAGQTEAVMLKWGLVPSWSKDPSIGSRMINARGETASEKPSFRAAFKKRRCLVPASGYYEWQPAPPGQKQKQPYFILPARGKDGDADAAPLLAMAGLWERRQDPTDGSILETFTIITTAANASMARVHDRMPVMLEPDQYRHWLDINNQDKNNLQNFIKTADEDYLHMYPVSTHVNSPRNDDPNCIQSIHDGELF